MIEIEMIEIGLVETEMVEMVEGWGRDRGKGRGGGTSGSASYAPTLPRRPLPWTTSGTTHPLYQYQCTLPIDTSFISISISISMLPIHNPHCRDIHHRGQRQVDLFPPPLLFPYDSHVSYPTPPPSSYLRFVVDSGYVKQKTYDPSRHMESLVVVPISRVAAQQRAGDSPVHRYPLPSPS